MLTINDLPREYIVFRLDPGQERVRVGFYPTLEEAHAAIQRSEERNPVHTNEPDDVEQDEYGTEPEADAPRREYAIWKATWERVDINVPHGLDTVTYAPVDGMGNPTDGGPVN
jgi:hypothetical protein